MANIILWPDNRLKIKAKPVQFVTDEIRSLLDMILKAIKDNCGIGLSGNHLGIDL